MQTDIDMNLNQDIEAFLASTTFAVVGASADRGKYGNRVLRFLMENGRNVVPVNPNAVTVEGLPAFCSLCDIPATPEAISINTQPKVTEQVVQEAIDLGIRKIWMQPGAENMAAIGYCHEAGVSVIHSGPCILLVEI